MIFAKFDGRPLIWAVLGLLGIPASATLAFAASPQMTRLLPEGAQRGTTVELTIGGARLADAEDLFFYEPGIVLEEIVEKNASRVRCRLKLADDCPLGEHGVRVRTASGISNLMTFHVGPYPIVDEEEPNNDFAEPQPIESNVTVHGVVVEEDVDYFAVQAKAGERLNVEIEGVRLGLTFFDPAVAILDRGRFVLASSDDTPLARQDAACGIVVPKDDTYIIQVRESSFRGSNQCRYRLHVGRFPRPTAVFPPGGKSGETLHVRYLGDPAGAWEGDLSLPNDVADTWKHFPEQDGLFAPSPLYLRVNDLPNVVEQEPNDAVGQATVGTIPAGFAGIIEKEGDIDHFRFAAKKGQRFDIRVFARTLRSPLDSVLSVHAADGKTIGSNDDSGSPDSYYRLNVPSDGEYVVRVRDHLFRGGDDFVYRIEVTPVVPKLTMGLPERTQYQDVTIAVPRGNRFAALVSATREDFGVDVTPMWKDLPKGVSAEVVPIPNGRPSAAVLFTAADDAPLAGSLAVLEGVAKVGDREIRGSLLQRTSLVRGQNNREIWEYRQDRAATAVVEAVPCSIRIVPPKVPIVQGGSMKLRIVADYQEGFDGPVTVQMLSLPPGVSAPASVTIPKGKNEVVMPLTANPNATVGTWKIVALGRFDTGGGPILVSTQLVELETAAPYVAFTYPQAAIEHGQTITLPIAVEVKTPFEGKAKVELLGLPSGITTEPREIDAQAKQCVFPLTADDKAPVGLHKSLVCRVTIIQQEEPIVHMLRGGTLRIQKPRPAPAAQPQPKPQPKPEPAKPAEKPLSRLEQLRLERAQQGNP
ncbi:MAG: peptidase [Planctomycetota bacterium]|nr:MAG: peptidase [Planctomycetota bacterium]